MAPHVVFERRALEHEALTTPVAGGIADDRVKANRAVARRPLPRKRVRMDDSVTPVTPA
jgi:hypothetical protein